MSTQKSMIVRKEIAIGTTRADVLKIYRPEELRQKMAEELDNILADVPDLLDQATRAHVEDEITAGRTADLVKMLSVRDKLVEETRKLYTGPLNESVKKFNETAKERRKGVQQAIERLTGLLDTWRRAIEAKRAAEQERIRKEAEEKARLKVSADAEAASQAREAQAMLEQSGDAEGAQLAADQAAMHEDRATAIMESSKVPEADITLRGVRGSYGASFGGRKTWAAELIDLRALNDECIFLIMTDDNARQAIRRALKPCIDPRLSALRGGLRVEEIEPLPGISFAQVTTTQVR